MNITSEKILNKLSELAKNKQFPSALIIQSFSQDQLETFALIISKIIVCSNNSYPSDDCFLCKKVQNKKLFDFVFLNGISQEITKEQIINVIQKLSLTSLEVHNQKICIIANAENLKKNASNALLKFLEEPPSDTYIILLTKNRQLILPTIRSRCHFYLLNENSNEIILNSFEKTLLSRDKFKYLLFSFEFKKENKIEIINNIEQALKRTIFQNFPEFIEDTVILLEDLKIMPNEKIAIDNYFIKLSERL